MSASIPPPPLPAGWVLATSKSTGKTYFFETKTGRSLYEHPSTAASTVGLAVVAPVIVVSSIFSHADELAIWTTRVNMSVVAANGDVLALRKAVDVVCLRLSNDDTMLPHYFPVLDKMSRSVVHERVEDAGLKSESVGEETGRHVVAWHPDRIVPPEVSALAAAEAALTAEAVILKAAEMAEMAASREAHIHNKGKGKGKGGRNTAAVADSDVSQAPTRASKKDGKDFAQIEKELALRKATKRKLPIAVMGTGTGTGTGKGTGTGTGTGTGAEVGDEEEIAFG